MANKFELASDYRWAIGVALISIVVFAGSLSGEFVYDDKRQILRNPLIQKSELYTQALTSDVWAFKTNSGVAASNYWRPTFTAWNIVNFAFFGTDPFGWHLTNVLLHALVAVFAFVFLFELGFKRIEAFFIATLFSVHPVHVESVAWVAGSPDILVSLFFLLSAIGAIRYARDGTNKHLAVVIVSLILALGSKEITVLAVPILAFLIKGKGDWKTKETLVLAGVVGAYLVVRYLILGGNAAKAPTSAETFSELIFTAPISFLFYLRQVFLPIEYSVLYGIRFVTELNGFVLFSIVAAVAASVALWLIASSEKKRIVGLLIFGCFLLPAFNVFSFPAEEVVHDRYLYLPILGVLIVVFGLVFEVAERYEIEQKWLSIGLAVLIAICSFQSVNYVPVWQNEVSLWRNATQVDPKSSFAWSQLGAAYSDKDRHADAVKAFDKALEISKRPRALLGRAMSRIATKDFGGAVTDLEAIMAAGSESTDIYTYYQACEALAVAHSNNRKLAEAERSLKTCISKLDIYRAALTTNLAVVYYQQNRKPEALKLLQSVRERAGRESLEQSKYVFARLGMLYAETGQKQKARSELQEFLRQTEGFSSTATTRLRKQANAFLKRLR